MEKRKKTGGRQKGTPNKKTALLENAVKTAAASLGQSELKWTAHSLLVAAYNNETLPIDMRLDAAKAAVRYEIPAKSETTLNDNTRWHVSDGSTSIEEWKRKHAPQAQSNDEETAH